MPNARSPAGIEICCACAAAACGVGAIRVDTLGAGEEFGWSWALGHPGVYQVRTLEPVEALVVSASELAARCDADSGFGYAMMPGLLGVVGERLQATRLTVIDMYLPEAKRAGT